MIIQGLAKAIKNSGKTRYQIAKDTGIDNSVLCRIVHDGSCGMKTAETLCSYLDLELKPRTKRKARK